MIGTTRRVIVVLGLALWLPSAAAAQQARQEPPETVDVQAYGLVATSFFWNASPLVNADAPVGALPGEEASLGASARQSRLGLRGGSPAAARALDADELSAVAEIDFLGGYYADNDVTFSMPHPRLRLMYGRVDWGALSVVAGQDWMVFAPLNPTSLVHVAVAGFQGTGNPWSRLPQLRAELRVADATLAVAVLAPVSTGPTDPAATGMSIARNPGPADRSETPSVQGRFGWTFHLSDRELVVGVSGHVGREEVSFGDPVRRATPVSWGAALDADLPLLPWLSVRGELFVGQDLDGFFSSSDVVDGKAVPVVGGWGQLSASAGPLDVHAGGGAEDPRPPPGTSFPDGAVERNAAVYGVVAGRAGELTAGLEVSYLWTRRAGVGTARGTQVALGVLLPF